MMLATMVPFIFVFASGIKLSEGKPIVAIASVIGLITVIAALVLAAFPGPDDPNKTLAAFKIVGLNIVMVGIGVTIFLAHRTVPATSN